MDLSKKSTLKLPRTGEIRITGAQAVLHCLAEEGVEVVFGIPGGAILPLYQRMADTTRIRHVLNRHEQASGHAASGYAQATGKVGVCLATSGPGATNLVTPLMDAYMDSVPVVAITGQVASNLIGTDAFQETDICSIVASITKHRRQIRRSQDIPAAIAEAFHHAKSGRPGPVLVDVTKDALQETTEISLPITSSRRLADPSSPPTPGPEVIEAAVEALQSCSRPVIYAGGGVVASSSHAALYRLAECVQAPVVTTLMARGVFPDNHPLHLGMPGMHGTVAAVAALQKSDLILALGARFDDRVTGVLSSFAPEAMIIQCDVDPSEISRKRRADIPLLGDCGQVISLIADRIEHELHLGRCPDYREWKEELDRIRREYPLGYDYSTQGVPPQMVIEKLGRICDRETIYTAGVGQHQMWAAQFIKFLRPRSFINSGGAGTMGYALPAALGAKIAYPEKTVWAVDGDGSFQMTSQELSTCSAEGIPIKIAIINNGTLGMVRQWQNLFYERNFSHTDLSPASGESLPDMVKLAEAHGCAAFRCNRREDIDHAIQNAMGINDKPVVVDFSVDKDSMVWPMVPPGLSNDRIIAAKNLRPDFSHYEEEETEHP
ncbi:acetolactate synthase large subunit [Nocardiopsis terrae]